MEQIKYDSDLLNHLTFPAFIVKDGVICNANHAAQQRQFNVGEPLKRYLGADIEEYESVSLGQLCMMLQTYGSTYYATVAKTGEYEIFYLEPDYSEPELRALSLAAQTLRGSLSEIMLCAESLEGDHRQHLQRSIHRMHRTICNMSDAGTYSKKRTSRMEVSEVFSVVGEIVEKAGAYLKNAGIHLEYSAPPKTVYSLIDREKLERGILNMLSNAAKFGTSETPVRAALHCEGNRIRFSVSNECERPIAEIYENLFSAFRREPDISNHGAGVGLGMTITRSAAFAHSGMLTFDHPREGAVRLTLSMPVNPTKDLPLRSPVLYPLDYTGGYDHVLTELSDILPDSLYT